MNIEIWTDGTTKPKKISRKKRAKEGPSAGAIIIKENKKVIRKESFYSGIINNSQSEYIAFIRAIEFVIELNPEYAIFYTDSNMIEKQMNFKYSANKDSIIPYYNLAINLLEKLESWEVRWISRKENREADKLAGDFIKNFELENKIKDI